MTVPVRLRIVYGQADPDAVFPAPFIQDLLKVHQVRLGAGAVHNVDFAVVFPMGAAVVDDGMQRCQTDTTGNEQKILSGKVGIHREAISVGSPKSELLPRLHGVQPFGDTAALFNGKFQKIQFRGAGGDGKQRLSNAGHGEHGTLTGNMHKWLFPVQTNHPEGLHIGCIHSNSRDHANHGNQRFSHLLASSPIVLTTLTMFM